ncbi:MAG: AAA family ATPase [Micromonosporaceae bacterium]
MDDDRSATVDDLIIERLDKADLPKEAYDLLLEVLFGEDGDAKATRDTPRATPPAGAAAAAEAAGAYLTSIEVQGFRGIGPAARLDLVPGPGLTIVTGRNGSGKSSFAEAAELALTGDDRRWTGRTEEWRDGWRNLHTSGQRYIRVGLALDRHRGGGVVECRWEPDADIGERTTTFQRQGERRHPVAALGWERPMTLFRPFLSYAELGRLLDGKPSERYDSLHSVLGLDRLADIERRLKDIRRDSDQERRRAQAALPQLREALTDHPDPRAGRIAALLDEPTPDLDRIDEIATAETDEGDDTAALRTVEAITLPDRERVSGAVAQVADGLRRISELAHTPAARARAVADLLQRALEFHRHHPGEPCPVCGGRTLDAAWADEAREQRQRLGAQAEQLDAAHRDVRDAVAQLRELVPAAPDVLDTGVDGLDLTEVRQAWRRFDDLRRLDDPRQVADECLDRFDALVAALAPVRERARDLVAVRQQAWHPLAEQIRAWTETARSSRLAARRYDAARRAVAWLQRVGEGIRNDRLAPLAAEAAEIWAMLRQESNVDVGAIQLAGTGTRRRVDINLAVDGEPGAALGVMSQGELHALGLSLFLPRATMPDSPFRFLVIDDPVQSMDPAKVYGLAKVLEKVAERRQVIVFTHDDRLPTAIRHLGIAAHLRVVSRRERSQVTVVEDRHGSPARRYLDDARAVARDEAVDPALRTRVVCVLVRDAIEATCHDVVFTRGIRDGRPFTEIEEELAQITRVREALTLALLGDRQRENELDTALRRLHPRAPDVVRAANRGSHGGGDPGQLTDLINDAERLVDRLVPR